MLRACLSQQWWSLNASEISDQQSLSPMCAVAFWLCEELAHLGPPVSTRASWQQLPSLDFPPTMSQPRQGTAGPSSVDRVPSSTSVWLMPSSTLQPNMRVLASHIATGDWMEWPWIPKPRSVIHRRHLTQTKSFIDDYVISFRREILARWLAVISWHHWNLSSLERNFFTAAQPLLCTSTTAECRIRIAFVSGIKVSCMRLHKRREIFRFLG